MEITDSQDNQDPLETSDSRGQRAALGLTALLGYPEMQAHKEHPDNPELVRLELQEPKVPPGRLGLQVKQDLGVLPELRVQ